ncbi:alpha/beta hydrolase [Microbacterium protaetiae]|uniref:Alpha/beta hydrolase n=1 Tax=Microbacterium protaetiae TaxID=2509458 RepID=A0A4P6EM34_9MICO|nr:alpha/beta fold hydrolase [Microbacterium protaetiae]QAY61297.1 alpha/beta hydrolase [Microbacterium protaetiae]
MNHSRRAVPNGPTMAVRFGVRAAIAGLTVALAAVAAIWGLVSLRVVRRIVTPPPRRPADTKIIGVDLAAQTITLERTADTELPGRYGLFTSGSESYVKLGTVLSADAATVKRKLLTEIGPDSSLAADAAFSGWYYDAPEQLHLPFTTELIGSAVGPCPAWLFPAEPQATTWVIQVHGRGTTRAECLRAVPLLHGLGFPVLVVSYRNDGDAPRSGGGTYMLGTTEWRDVDAAMAFALRRGAERILLMGWSMGGAIALQTELNSPRRDAICGLVLESPVIDWRSVLGYQAGQLRLPQPVTELALGALQSGWARSLTHAEAIPLDALDVVRRAGELRHPILILHSDDDGFVPSDASHALAKTRPDLVELQAFQVARHTKLWNYDPERWSGAIREWLTRHELVAAGQP